MVLSLSPTSLCQLDIKLLSSVNLVSRKDYIS
ncbi:putative xanthine/uracil permease [Venturia inaequalis]|nr:putative xanthine/uracil permease [Venturia inaequalis]